MTYMLQRRWKEHDQAVARALALDPQHEWTHAVRLEGLGQRRARVGQTVAQLLRRLEEQPGDEFTLGQLRDQFSFRTWLSRPWRGAGCCCWLCQRFTFRGLLCCWAWPGSPIP
ncbi:hypothetical protein ACFP81_11045 [Deinococcus lacus]|uniref:Uncharacterized protein n=1 Tax=Deinococcus lacus TaxID=392561 RepID=A0ABW1YDQ6_9DEIO